ncbi:MAG TPA: glycosyltransferase [Lentimicrobium sp.]|nr:glycosyltransferase [Lentimicrobium sp.]
MIFVVVGTQEPFDRLIQYLDEWSSLSGFKDIEAQISKAKYFPGNFPFFDFIPPAEFDERFNKADLIISHAGMGTIISALQYSKPIIVMPRLAKYKEHRNDHQLATAISFSKLNYVKTAFNKDELFDALNERSHLLPAPPISPFASSDLINAVSQFIWKK